MRINNNMMAANTHRQLNVNQAQGSKSLEKLSSGLRINRAGDDAAGLAISEKMRGQIRGLNQATRNAQDGISLIQTAEGALNETHAILQRMRELAVQSATDTNATEDRAAIQSEFTELAKEITRIATDTQFNGQTLLNGDGAGKFQSTFHIGSNAGQSLTLEIDKMDAVTLGVGTMVGDPASLEGINLSSATTPISTIDTAINTVSSQRANLGAVQNRLEHTISNLGTSSENLQAAESRIRDVDMAAEMMQFTKNNILQQAATAMLAQANQAPQMVLQLLR
jgi:flagellin